MSGSIRLRCAVYTRKSSEEGLEQEFNSLDAQREACAAFVASQVGLGWKLVLDRYDDGGVSGGTMERPALQRLLRDIEDRKINVVVVYKIDRLTRSLTDFAKIVEVFDAATVSFVSVTQQFNTTTSMGRLTLNVLLSFAQFEREVTAERIRDKIAASKAKGMWMGGTVPFGYRIENRKMVVDEPAAAEIRTLFDRYLVLGSVPALAAELNHQAREDGRVKPLLHSFTGQGRRRPAKRVGIGKLYYMLSNPIYIGKVRHRKKLYDGEHCPIVTDEIFAAVQDRLANQAPRQKGLPVQRDIHLLNGLLFDETGDRLSPIHATKAGKRYRYYISTRLKTGQPNAAGGWRLPAAEIERIVICQLKDLFSDTAKLSFWLQHTGDTPSLTIGLHKATKVVSELTNPVSSPRLHKIVHLALRRVEVTSDRVRLVINTSSIAGWLSGATARDADGANDGPDDTHIIDLPLAIRKRGVEQRLVIVGQRSSWRHIDQPLIDVIARANAYLAALADGQTRSDIATRYSVHPEDISRLLPLAFLSPSIVNAILTGRQPADLSVRDLTRRIDLPHDWAEQHRLLAI